MGTNPGVLVVSYLWLPAPPGDPSRPLYSSNIHYVYGLGNEPTSWGPWWFALLLGVFPLGFYLPTHLTLKALFPRPGDAEGERNRDPGKPGREPGG